MTCSSHLWFAYQDKSEYIGGVCGTYMSAEFMFIPVRTTNIVTCVLLYHKVQYVGNFYVFTRML